MESNKKLFLLKILVGTLGLILLVGLVILFTYKPVSDATVEENPIIPKEEVSALENKVETKTNPEPIEKDDTKTYFSDKLGVSFSYRRVNIGDPLPTITEKGNQIIVAEQSIITVFKKEPKQSLEEAIATTFLNGYDAKKCWVTKYNDVGLYGYEYAGITYPKDDINGDPAWTHVEEFCPINFAEINAIRYFLYNPDTPDRFLFVDNGQSAAAAAPAQYPNEDFSYTIKITGL